MSPVPFWNLEKGAKTVEDTVAQDLLRSDHLSGHGSMVLLLLQEPSPAHLCLDAVNEAVVLMRHDLMGARRAAQGSIAEKPSE